MIGTIQKAIRAVEDADSELDSVGYDRHHFVRMQLQNSATELKNFLKEMRDAEKNDKTPKVPIQ